VVRGAGVESVLQTVRIAVITHAGASGMIVELESPLGLSGAALRADFDGEPSLFATLTLRFNGVDLDGVFWRPRGVGAALEGVFPVLVGVVCVEPALEGVPGIEPLAERLIPAELAERELSRYV
jgi:hypothetical protein